jgi:peptidoglycan/LPS O-acetylase OafA/YrhL
VVILFPGVAVFFVISGFLIPRSFERLAEHPRQYFIHRMLRIYPGLWVCLALSILVLGLFGFLGAEVLGSPTFWVWLVGQLTCGQFFNPEFFRDFGVGAVNGALWTISVELQFYVAVPLLYMIRRRKWLGRIVLATTFVLSFAAFCHVDAATNSPGGFHHAPVAAKLLFVTLVPHWWMFVLGILLQRNFQHLRGFLEGRFLPHFTAYCGIALARFFLVGRESSWSFLFYGGYLPERILLATTTVAAAYSLRDLSNRLLRGVDISYGVYIYHFLVINIMIELGRMESLAAVAAVFLLSAAAGAISWFAIEKRALALKPVVGTKPVMPEPATGASADGSHG